MCAHLCFLGFALATLGTTLEVSPEPLVVVSGPVVADAPAVETPPVDLNRATLAELQRLPGIGENRARDIVEHRLRRPFRRPSDLMRVRGIGRRLYYRLKPRIQVLRPSVE